MFFQYDKFPHSHGFMALRRHTHAWGGCPSPKAACTAIIFKCRQPSAGNRKPTPSPRGRGQNPPPFRTEIRAARRSPHPNPLPRERGRICCEPKKSSLHIGGNIQSESAGCFFTAEKPHRPKSAGTPIPPNQARCAFAAAAHTPNPAHRQHSVSPRLSR